jgi:hypothetical protein
MANIGQIRNDSPLMQAASFEGEPAKKEPVQEPAKEPVQEPVKKPTTNEPSSQAPMSFDERQEELFGYLTDKAGRDIKSFEDLFQAKEIEKTTEIRKYDSPQAEAFDKYHAETGRGIEDFMQLNKDWDSVSDNEAILNYLKDEHSYLNEEEIKVKFESAFNVPSKLDPEEHTVEEIAARDREITLSNITRKEYASKARESHNNAKEQYMTPMESALAKQQENSKLGQEQWTNGMDEALNGIGEIDINGFQYQPKNIDKYKESYSTIDGVLNSFKDEQGQLDYNKLAKTLILGDQIEGILSASAKNTQADTIKNQMQDKSNYSKQTNPENNTPPENKDDASAKYLEHIRGESPNSIFKRR